MRSYNSGNNVQQPDENVALLAGTPPPQHRQRYAAAILAVALVGTAAGVAVCFVTLHHKSTCVANEAAHASPPWATRTFFAPYEAWEEGVVTEPCGVTFNGDQHFFYRGGAEFKFIGHARPLGDGWERDATPIIAGSAPWVRVVWPYALEMLYTSVDGHEVACAGSLNGSTWYDQTVAIPKPDNWLQWGTRAIHNDVLYQNVLVQAQPPAWTVFIYATQDNTTYTQVGQLDLPKLNSCGSTTGARFELLKNNNQTKVWYTATSGFDSSFTTIVSALSTDMRVWHGLSREIDVGPNSADPTPWGGALLYSDGANILAAGSSD